jgi:hypothetical protein
LAHAAAGNDRTCRIGAAIMRATDKCFFSQEVDAPGEMGVMQAVVATAVLLTRLSQIVNAFFHAL